MSQPTDETPQEVELQIASVDTSISRETARMAYNFLMTSIVARLYLYLFGEFDKDYVEVAVEKIRETKTVMDAILNKEKTPMRAVYEFLIDKEFFEDQKLSSDAMLFIDMPDSLQLRISDEKAVQVIGAPMVVPDPLGSESSECQ